MKPKIKIYMDMLWEAMLLDGSITQHMEPIYPRTPSSTEYCYIMADLLDGVDSEEIWKKIKEREYSEIE